jgi:hypothetical protein
VHHAAAPAHHASPAPSKSAAPAAAPGLADPFDDGSSAKKPAKPAPAADKKQTGLVDPF